MLAATTAIAEAHLSDASVIDGISAIEFFKYIENYAKDKALLSLCDDLQQKIQGLEAMDKVNNIQLKINPKNLNFFFRKSNTTC